MNITKKISHWFYALSMRERMLVGSAASVGVVMLLLSPIQSAIQDLSNNEALIRQRRREYMDLGASLRRYKQLSDKVKTAEAAYESSQMTFEQVTAEVDKIVKESIGKDDYDLKPGVGEGNALSSTLESREFLVRIRSLTMDQLITLLYKIESGKSALYLGKLNLTKSGTVGELSADLEISTLTKKRG